MALEPKRRVGDIFTMELFENDAPDPATGNLPALSVSELSGAVKRMIEGEFGRVRVRGEVGRVSRPSSGHLYFDLKDDRAVLAAVCWRDAASKLPHRPEEGLEVVVTGRLTTFPGQSKYQLLVETVEPAGVGALMAMLDQRRRAFAAEGLFDADRKQPIPFLPSVIAVVTSPSGAVIRDILHRLRDRFPCRVLIWPVAVQGAQSAPQVAAAVRGLNALSRGGDIPRPDVIIVARGGGSVEDLWGFNDELVVRAVAEGTIPLISAVGHETDTTLIDYAADLRAPTPTAAAEMAVPVLSELGGRIADSQSRLWRSVQAQLNRPAERLEALARTLGRPRSVVEHPRQRFDLTASRLEASLHGFIRSKRIRADALSLPVHALRSFVVGSRAHFLRSSAAFTSAIRQDSVRRKNSLKIPTRSPIQLALRAAQSSYNTLAPRLQPSFSRQALSARRELDLMSGRLFNAHRRALAMQAAEVSRRSSDLRMASAKLDGLQAKIVSDRRSRLETLDRLRLSLGHMETLRRGFAIVRNNDGLVTSSQVAAKSESLTLEFFDGKVGVRPLGTPDTPQGGGTSASDATTDGGAIGAPHSLEPKKADQGRSTESRSVRSKQKPNSDRSDQGSLF